MDHSFIPYSPLVSHLRNRSTELPATFYSSAPQSESQICSNQDTLLTQTPAACKCCLGEVTRSQARLCRKSRQPEIASYCPDFPAKGELPAQRA